MVAQASAISEQTQAFFDARDDENRSRLTKVVIGMVIVAIYPLIDSLLGIGLVGSFIPILIYVILAMGLNIVVGYAGLLDLGYVAFYVIGAYAQAFLSSPQSVFVQKGWIPGFMQNFWVSMLFSWILAAMFGVLLGAPTLRLRGDYLAIVTLGFGEIVPDFFTNAIPITNGPKGMGQIAKPPAIPLGGTTEIAFSTTNQWSWFWLILIVAGVSLWAITRLYDSRLGRAWQAIREDEIAAASMGINPLATKLWAFALGASFSGFAGAIFSGYVQVVYPDQFQFSISIMILSMVILGGIGNIYGVIIGALIIGTFDRILTEKLNGPINWLGDHVPWGPFGFIGDFLSDHNLTSDRFLIFGLALVLIMVLRPGGLFPSRQRAQEMAGETRNEAIDGVEADEVVRDARVGEVH